MGAAGTALVSAAGLVVSTVALVTWSGLQVEPAEPIANLEQGAVALDWSTDATRDRQERRVRTTSASLGRSKEDRATRPAQVTIPSVELAAQVRPVGVSNDGQMQLPPDPEVMGWYRFGSAPDSPTGGSVVLAGHLDSREFGLGPLVRLRDVKVGSRVIVLTDEGHRQDYAVRRVQRFDRQGLPQEVFGRNGPELLRLITCGGDYDSETGYEQNLVVTAAPVR
jgi:hypothetical protein